MSWWQTLLVAVIGGLVTGVFALGGTWLVVRAQRDRDAETRRENRRLLLRTELIELVGSMDRLLVEARAVDFWLGNDMQPSAADVEPFWTAFRRVRAARDPLIVEPNARITELLGHTEGLMRYCLAAIGTVGPNAEARSDEQRKQALKDVSDAGLCGRAVAELARMILGELDDPKERGAKQLLS